MAKDPNFNVGVNQFSDRANRTAQRAMRGAQPSVQVKVDQPDTGGPAAKADNLNRSKQTVVPSMTRPAKGATPPSKVNPMQRPMGARSFGQGR